MSKKVESYLALAAVVVGLAGPRLVALLQSDGLKTPAEIVGVLMVLAGSLRLALNPQLVDSPADPK